MAEYIEREKAIEAAIDAADEWDGGYNPHRAVQIRDGVKAITAADVRPVVRGKWIHTGGKFSRNKIVDRRILTCSLCGNMLSMEGVNAGRGDANYCPNCGADMREES